MFRRGRLSSIEKDVTYFIKGYFKDLLADFDIYKPVYETLIIKTRMEPTIDTLLCYIMGQVVGIVNLMLDQAGLSVARALKRIDLEPICARTRKYVQLEAAIFSDGSDDFVSKVAKNVEEACELIELGFEYVHEIDGNHLYRKRK